MTARPPDLEVPMASTPTRATQSTIDALHRMLVAEAAAAHAAYPQYAGRWDGWRVAEVTTRVRTKSGVAFEPGDLVLVSPETRTEKTSPRGKTLPYAEWSDVVYATAYSRRTGNNTGLPATKIREIQIVATV